jgi:hypothetical protein
MSSGNRYIGKPFVKLSKSYDDILDALNDFNKVNRAALEEPEKEFDEISI